MSIRYRPMFDKSGEFSFYSYEINLNVFLVLRLFIIVHRVRNILEECLDRQDLKEMQVPP